jgi:hypothetical protein
LTGTDLLAVRVDVDDDPELVVALKMREPGSLRLIAAPAIAPGPTEP